MRGDEHPTEAQLQAFGAGTLADDQDTTIVTHLEGCPDCRQVLAAVPRDGLETLLVAATKERPPVVGATLQPHEYFDRYRILRVLEQGGMATIYEAHDERLRRVVALKVMKPELVAAYAAKERFFREARTAAALEHDHIVPIYHVGEERGLPFLVMPLLKGQSLASVINSRAELSVPTILSLGKQIALGLAAAHERGLIHRDIKPANLFLEGLSQQVVILDFGLALPTHEDVALTQTGMIIGTPAYMAPEQARGDPIDARADLFSVGVVMYRLLTGQLPFRGATTIAILTALAVDRPVAPHVLNPAIPRRVSDLVVRLLEKDPARRPASAMELVRLLDTALQPPRRRWWPWPVGAAVLVILVAGSVAAWWPRTMAPDPVPEPAPAPFVAVAPPSTPPEVPKGTPNWALRFENLSEGVTVPTLSIPREVPLTLEMHLTLPEQSYVPEMNILGRRYQMQVTLNRGQRLCIFGKHHQSDERLPIGKIYTSAATPNPHPLGQRFHLAAVRTDDEFILYVDGKMEARAPVTTSAPGLLQFGTQMLGDCDEVRLSNVVRYTANFTPPHRHEPDEHTLALFHCDESTGDTLHDASKHRHQATIKGAKWVPVDSQKP